MKEKVQSAIYQRIYSATSCLSSRQKMQLWHRFCPKDDEFCLHWYLVLIFLPRDRPKECHRTSFMEFVNRVLALQANSPITKFSLKCHKGVDESLVEDWIRKALRHGATDLSLVLLFPSSGYTLPSSIFFYSQNLIKLKLGSWFCWVRSLWSRICSVSI